MNSKRIILYCLLICFLISTLTDAKIVFKSYRDGSRSLYVMDDDGSNVQRLTASPGLWPAWSPDGKQIAFNAIPPEVPNWPQIYAIYIINSDGTDEHRLTNEDTFESHPTWSPDGKYIAFDSNRLDHPGREKTDIWRINLETKELQRLTRTEWAVYPAWSPDGKYIVYAGRGIHLMNADGRRHQQLWLGAHPRWSPDSQSLVYSVTIHDEKWNVIRSNIFIHTIKDDKRQFINLPGNWSVHGVCFMGPKQILIAGRHLAKENPNREKHDIYSYHLVTREMVNLTNTPAVDDFSMDWISDDVLSVSPKDKITVTWGKLKQ